ncbi:alpha/beta fold hydrolase [Synechococcus sp. PCC 6312]|uniref:alpha/beta fold hydrolase n=1 Tax=Synechococcus sp. (strain ATCC 27167 / PCC 6312) TaxID=195253 RepID=UPI00029EF56E|nr:alpha/beta hydrolase [Synechococcus sp. PCC 6312]AFY60518.1 putative hydrolase or acyltransferase of alpha/beta superfamily [Synechococcus sp. PCC 6312]
MTFLPFGFQPQALITPLGKLIYYTPYAEIWGQPKHSQKFLFLHSLGGGSSQVEWAGIYPAFASRYRIYVPDLIGWGASDHPVRDYHAADYWQMVELLIEKIGAPVAVIASSLTAGLVVRLAIQKPELFSGLCLVGPTGFSDFGNDYGQGLAAQLAGTPGLDQIIYTLGAGNALAVRNFLEQFIFAQPERLTPATVNAYLNSAQEPGAEFAALASLRGDLCFDLSRYLGQLAVPSIFIWGEASKFNSVELGHRLAALNPQAIQGFFTVPTTGVLPHLEFPASVIALIEAHFLPLISK